MRLALGIGNGATTVGERRQKADRLKPEFTMTFKFDSNIAIRNTIMIMTLITIGILQTIF